MRARAQRLSALMVCAMPLLLAAELFAVIGAALLLRQAGV